jgi:hypothetical protein
VEGRRVEGRKDMAARELCLVIQNNMSIRVPRLPLHGWRGKRGESISLSRPLLCMVHDGT